MELIYDPVYLQKNPIDEKIIVNCQGGQRKEIPVSKDILQLSLPQSCSVKNRFFQIDEVLTSEIPAKYIQDNEITLDFKEVSLNETEEKGPQQSDTSLPHPTCYEGKKNQDTRGATILC